MRLIGELSGTFLVERDGAVHLVLLLGNAAKHHQRIGAVGVERTGDLQVERDDVFGAVAVQRAGKREQHAGRTLLGGGDLLHLLLVIGDALAQRVERRVVRQQVVADGDGVERLLLVALRRFEAGQRHDGAHESVGAVAAPSLSSTASFRCLRAERTSPLTMAIAPAL
jgi:hypothetical protein